VKFRPPLTTQLRPPNQHRPYLRPLSSALPRFSPSPIHRPRHGPLPIGRVHTVHLGPSVHRPILSGEGQTHEPLGLVQDCQDYCARTGKGGSADVECGG
jgi:hypothetical protein